MSPAASSNTSPSRSESWNQSPLRIVGVDDGPVSESSDRTFLVAVLLEGTRIVDLRIGTIQVDGRDAQRVLLSLMANLAYDAVMLSGISFGGFNLIDIAELARKVRRPVIVVIRDRPDNRAVRDALRKHFQDWRRRWGVVRRAGTLHSCRPVEGESSLYFEIAGAPPSFGRSVIMASSAVARLPEPVRVAGILAKGLRGLSGFHEVDEPNLQ